MNKIAIVEDHPLYRKSVVDLVSDHPNYEVILEAGNGDELIRKLNPNELPDIVLVDVEMPVMDGPATVKVIREKYGSQVMILGLSVHTESQLIKEMLRLGANGYLTKAASADELIIALDKVLDVQFYISKDVARLVDVKELHKRDIFSELEEQILLLICQQKKNKEIAEIMNVSLNTINTYRTRMIDKIGAINAVGLVLFAIKEGYFKIK